VGSVVKLEPRLWGVGPNESIGEDLIDLGLDALGEQLLVKTTAVKDMNHENISTDLSPNRSNRGIELTTERTMEREFDQLFLSGHDNSVWDQASTGFSTLVSVS
jgi:hypothetical protein